MILAKSLSQCMQDDKFKSSFEKSNPGMLDALNDKEMLDKMLKAMAEMEDLKSAKDMVEGAGEADQQKQLQAALDALMNQLLTDMDSVVSGVLKKKLIHFEKVMREAHSMREDQQLQGIADRPDLNKDDSQEEGKGEGISPDIAAPNGMPVAESMNGMNAEMLMNEEILSGLVFAVDIEELIMKGARYNTVKLVDVNTMKRD